jgi:hypothetical protein
MITRKPLNQSPLADLDQSVLADLAEYMEELVRRAEWKPLNQSALADLIENVEEFLRAEPDNDEITLPKVIVANMVELLKKLRLGGRPGTRVEDYMREWAIHIKARERRERLRADGKSAVVADKIVIRELKEKYPQHFGKRSDAAIKQWLHRRGPPRRYSR